MTKPFITVKITRQYGNETIYPVSVEAHIFARMAGTKTLTRDSIELIKSLGYSVVVQQSSPSTL